jgi:hypothetical protein
MSVLPRRGFDERQTGHRQSNGYATDEAAARRWQQPVAVAFLLTVFASAAVGAQDTPPTHDTPNTAHESRFAVKAGLFIAGAAAGLAAHESGHLAFDYLFDATPRVTRVDFHGIPFFAVTHRADLPRRKEFVISSAGFAVQHAGSEWILMRKPKIRWRRAPLAKGVLTFNVLTSVAYAGAAFARTGPHERDTRGMADSAGIDERAIGVMVLAPAVLDTWRYFHPRSKWAAWASRGAKAGMVLLVVR